MYIANKNIPVHQQLDGDNYRDLEDATKGCAQKSMPVSGNGFFGSYLKTPQRYSSLKGSPQASGSSKCPLISAHLSTAQELKHNIFVGQ